MAHDLPYVSAYGKIGPLFDKIAKAKIPDAFTTRFLAKTLGMTTPNDRQLIPLLKKLGFLEQSGTPTNEYGKLKNNANAGAAIAEGIKRAYAPLYEADESAHTLEPEELRGLIAQVSGAEEQLTRYILGTLNGLVKAANFSKLNGQPKTESEPELDGESEKEIQKATQFKAQSVERNVTQNGFNPAFHFNVQVHLPSNGTEATYLAIFNALRKALG